VGRNEARGNGQGRSASGNEPDPEKGPIFWPVYFYSLANLEFGLAGRQSRVSSWTTVGIAICTTRFEIRDSKFEAARDPVFLCWQIASRHIPQGSSGKPGLERLRFLPAKRG